ncbi:MAG TPA: M23 family metallopeptidase [Acidobacteria bacterium]|nr:M23 family metallopeptidase [Acidobacteriota bacterium]
MYEVQFHPADIRKQVRYFFLSRQAFRRLVGLGIVLGLLLLVGLALAPMGLHSLLLSSRLHVLRHQNQVLREVLQERRTTLKRLQNDLAAATTRARQMSLILGAPLHEETEKDAPHQIRQDGVALVPEATVALRLASRLDRQTRFLLAQTGELARFVQEHREITRMVPSICPLPVGSFVLTSPFGERISPFTNQRDFHAGIDLAAREGTHVLAPGGGRVVFAGRFPLRRNVRWWRYGNVIVLAHGNRYVTVFAHLKDILVRRGQRVQRGEVIGTVGSTGWSTSPHLHYEVRVRQQPGGEPKPVDPRVYILNYQWKATEKVLAASRRAPAPAFDPLPSIVRLR